MSISCAKTCESLSLCIDGKLDEQTMQQVQCHLEACEDCREKLGSLAEIIGVLKDLPEIPLPDGFDGRLHQALVHESRLLKNDYQPGFVPVGKGGRRSGQINWKRVSAAAAIFLVVLAGASLYNQGFFDQIYNAMYLADQSPEKAAAGESESVDLFAQTPYPYEGGEGEDKEQQLLFSSGGADGDRQTSANVQNNVPDPVGETIQGSSKSAKNLVDSSADSVQEEENGGQGDRGSASQRQLQLSEEGEMTITDAAMQSMATNSPFRHLAEERLQDTFSVEAVDFGTLKYSLVQYVKTDENAEIFVYNIQGTKNGVPVAQQIKIQADANGIHLLP